jgi:putative ABC transport system ATP-binding protein
MALLEVRGVVKTYEGEGVPTPALRGVSLDIREGEFVAIMGPSGSGKSTLLHILGLLARPTSGGYRLDGTSVEQISEEVAAVFRNEKIGFVFQLFHLLPRTSVLHNVLLPLVYSTVPVSERESRAVRALEAVGMTHRLQHVPSQLSGGERQRVAIARAMVNQPRIVFADEPTGNLDSASGQLVMEAFEQLHAQGHTIVLVTHETFTAAHAERILHMEYGKIVREVVVRDRGGDHAPFHK